jgi:uncharacterized membrane protein
MITRILKYLTPLEIRLIIFAGIYCVISIPVLIITRAFIHLFFAWNMMLAVMPLLISLLLRHSKITKKWIKWILVVIWILFLPNAFYIITDFIHLTQHTFYIYEHPYAPLEYVREIDSYVALIHIFLGAMIGVMLATKSIANVLEFLKQLFPKWFHLTIIDISLLSSLGIYIGRFLRFNTWDMLRPFQLIYEVFTSFDLFALYFIILFTIVHIILIYIFVPMMQSEQLRLFRLTKKD